MIVLTMRRRDALTRTTTVSYSLTIPQRLLLEAWLRSFKPLGEKEHERVRGLLVNPLGESILAPARLCR